MDLRFIHQILRSRVREVQGAGDDLQILNGPFHAMGGGEDPLFINYTAAADMLAKGVHNGHLVGSESSGGIHSTNHTGLGFNVTQMMI